MAAAALLLLLLLPAAVVSSLAPPSIAPSPTAGLTALLLEYSRVLDPVAVSADTALRDELWPQIAAALADDAWHARAPEVLVVAVRAMHLAHQRIVKEMLSRDQSASLSLVDVATAAHEWTAAPLTAVLARYPRAQLDAAGPLGYTALQHAVAATELATIQALLAAGASVHAAPDPLRMTPLHLAARACNHQAVETLLAGGASPLARDAHGRTAVDLAAASWCQMPELGEAEVPGQLLGSMAAASLPSPVAAAAAGPDTVVDGGWRPASRTAASVPSCRLVLQTVQANISLQQFLAAAVSAQRPMVLVNATSAWPLTAALARPALARQFADVDLAVSKIPYGDIFNVRAGVSSMAEFLGYMDSQATSPDPSPFYVFDHQFLQSHTPRQYPLPAAVVEALGSLEQAHQFFLGPAESGSPFHFHEDAVNAMLYGSKQWWLTPPGRARYETQHPTQTQRVVTEQSVTCMQQPGDLIYVPRLWGHSTRNWAETVGIAVEFDGSVCMSREACPHFVL